MRSRENPRTVLCVEGCVHLDRWHECEACTLCRRLTQPTTERETRAHTYIHTSMHTCIVSHAPIGSACVAVERLAPGIAFMTLLTFFLFLVREIQNNWGPPEKVPT